MDVMIVCQLTQTQLIFQYFNWLRPVAALATYRLARLGHSAFCSDNVLEWKCLFFHFNSLEGVRVWSSDFFSWFNKHISVVPSKPLIKTFLFHWYKRTKDCGQRLPFHGLQPRKFRSESGALICSTIFNIFHNFTFPWVNGFSSVHRSIVLFWMPWVRLFSVFVLSMFLSLSISVENNSWDWKLLW